MTYNVLMATLNITHLLTEFSNTIPNKSRLCMFTVCFSFEHENVRENIEQEPVLFLCYLCILSLGCSC